MNGLYPRGAIALVVVGLLGLSACARSSTPKTTATTATIAPPASIKAADKLVFCSDVTYPPEEFYRGTTPVGSDVDIGTAISGLMGVKPVFVNTGFEGIIAALLSHKCDAIISGMNDTTQRRQSVNFVDYISVGQSLMVKPGNPDHITDLASLSGRSVAVEVGTTNAQFLEQESKTLTSQGKPGIKVQTFPKDIDAANALKTGKVDAYFGDSPVVAYYIATDPSSYAFGGSPINPIRVGMAIRKDDPQLMGDVQKAIALMYRNGEICRILTKWKMSQFGLPSHRC